MSAATNPELIRAYQLIEADELDKARNLLDSYLESDRDNPDAWWLYAHAVTEPMEAQNALRNILRIDPNYPGAKALLAESEEVLTPKTNTTLPRLASRPVHTEDGERVPDFLDGLDVDEDDFDSFDEDDFDTADVVDADEESEAPRSRRLLFILVPILIAVIVLAGVVALVNPFNRNRVTSPTPTSIVAGVTSPAATSTTDSFIDTTEEPVTQGFDAITSALSAYTLVENGVGVEQTSVGNSLIASICNDPARGLVATTLSALDAVAGQSGSLSGQADFVGVRIVDCERGNLPLRTVVVNIADAQAFAAGTINASELRTRLQPIDA